jgi:hypothetical protein
MTANPRLRLAPAAADQLRQGAVDPRVMIVLAALTGAHTLTVSAFPAEPLEPPDAVRRRVLLGPVDGRPAADPPPELRDWLAAQQPPFAPAVVQPDPDGLVLGYAGAPPAGLLPGG